MQIKFATANSAAEELRKLKSEMDKKLSQRKQGINELTNVFQNNKQEYEEYKERAESTMEKYRKQIAELEQTLEKS